MPYVSRVVVERIVACPFSVAHEYAAHFLEEAGGKLHVRVPLRDFIYALPGNVWKPVTLVFALHPDDTEHGRIHDAFMVDWQAGSRMFPDFHGTLRLRIDSVHTTLLALEGAYRPPLGIPGRMFDALLGRRIARATMQDLLDRIAGELERREAAFRSAPAPAEGSGITA